MDRKGRNEVLLLIGNKTTGQVKFETVFVDVEWNTGPMGNSSNWKEFKAKGDICLPMYWRGEKDRDWKRWTTLGDMNGTSMSPYDLGGYKIIPSVELKELPEYTSRVLHNFREANFRVIAPPCRTCGK